MVAFLISAPVIYNYLTLSPWVINHKGLSGHNLTLSTKKMTGTGSRMYNPSLRSPVQLMMTMVSSQERFMVRLLTTIVAPRHFTVDISPEKRLNSSKTLISLARILYYLTVKINKKPTIRPPFHWLPCWPKPPGSSKRRSEGKIPGSEWQPPAAKWTSCLPCLPKDHSVPDQS